MDEYIGEYRDTLIYRNTVTGYFKTICPPLMADTLDGLHELIEERVNDDV